MKKIAYVLYLLVAALVGVAAWHVAYWIGGEY
jgi:hypothetical protein